MSAALIANNAVQHPFEGGCIAINLAAGVAANLDCTSLIGSGAMITVFNQTAGQLGYKFSPSATPNISVTSTGGADACLRMQTMTSERGWIPRAMPHLHLISPNAGFVYVAVTGTDR